MMDGDSGGSTDGNSSSGNGDIDEITGDAVMRDRERRDRALARRAPRAFVWLLCLLDLALLVVMFVLVTRLISRPTVVVCSVGKGGG